MVLIAPCSPQRMAVRQEGNGPSQNASGFIESNTNWTGLPNAERMLLIGLKSKSSSWPMPQEQQKYCLLSQGMVRNVPPYLFCQGFDPCLNVVLFIKDVVFQNVPYNML